MLADEALAALMLRVLIRGPSIFLKGSQQVLSARFRP